MTPMKIVRVRNGRSGAELASWVSVADRWWRRAIGLLGRSTLDSGEGLLLAPCNAVHTIGMRFPIDVAFLDANGCVVSMKPALRPGRLVRGGRGTQATLELRAGGLAQGDTRPGDPLIFEEEVL
ncbi:MAG: DUF192 domain-containing protein [Gemmatimonadetes bacterium]|nr:DUF192 domain-containing protein [Gemmatimonadota bacterium]